jgi:hypothetical protein
VSDKVGCERTALVNGDGEKEESEKTHNTTSYEVIAEELEEIARKKGSGREEPLRVSMRA